MILHFETVYPSSVHLEKSKKDISTFFKNHVKEIDIKKLNLILDKIMKGGVATLVRNYQYKIVGVALLCKEKINKLSSKETLEVIGIHNEFRSAGIGQQLIEKLQLNKHFDFDVRDINLANGFFAKLGLQVV